MLFPSLSLVALPSGLGLNVSPSGKHFLVLQTRSGPGDLLHSTCHITGDTCASWFSGRLIPLNVTPGVGVWIHRVVSLCGLFVPKGQCLATVSLCLEQSQALYLLDNDESGMVLKNLPFHTSRFN